MPEGLIVVLENLMGYVATTAEYLAANQRVVNLVLLLLLFCLSIVAFTAYARARQALDEVAHQNERRPTGAARATDPRFADSEGADPLSPAVPPVVPGAAAATLGDAAHRLSRLEEGFLQLNRELSRFEDTTADLKEQIGLLAVRLRETAPSEGVGDIVPSIGHLASARAVTVIDQQPSHEFGLPAVPDEALQKVAEISRRIDELNATIDSQRRTVLAIGQVVAQMPDWRKLRGSMIDSLEQIVAATDTGSRRVG